MSTFFSFPPCVCRGTARPWLVRATVLSVVLVLGCEIAGCIGLPPDAREQLLDATREYDQGHHRSAERKLSTLILAHGDKSEIAEAYYVRGLCNLRLRCRDAARNDFSRALEGSTRGDLKARAHACLGSLACDDEDYLGAIGHYEVAVEGLPNEPPLDEIFYRLGVALQRVGRWRDAREVLPKVWWSFPGSSVEAAARRRFNWPFEYFVIQCGAFERVGGAENLIRRLSQHGLKARRRCDFRQDNVVYVVQVGQYRDYASARGDLQRVRDVTADAFIMP